MPITGIKRVHISVKVPNGGGVDASGEFDLYGVVVFEGDTGRNVLIKCLFVYRDDPDINKEVTVSTTRVDHGNGIICHHFLAKGKVLRVFPVAPNPPPVADLAVTLATNPAVSGSTDVVIIP